MKTYYISIAPIGSFSNSKLYSVSVPDYFNTNVVKTILSQYTRYKVLVYDEPHYGFSEDNYAHKRSIERLIKAVKNIKFYRNEIKSVRTERIIAAKTFYFPSNCNIKTTVEIREKLQPVTFFEVKTRISSLTGKPDDCKEKCHIIDCLLKELEVRSSCIKRLYLVGDWEILKKSSCCKEENGIIYDEYVAIEWEREVKEEQVEI